VPRKESAVVPQAEAAAVGLETEGIVLVEVGMPGCALAVDLQEEALLHSSGLGKIVDVD
jgi:hypothetical protein